MRWIRPSEVIELNGDVGDLVRTVRIALVPDAMIAAHVIVVCSDDAGQPVPRYGVTVMYGRDYDDPDGWWREAFVLRDVETFRREWK